MAEEMKPWRCKNEHVMGMVQRNGKGIRHLLLYRQAIDLGGEQPEDVDVMAVIEGYVADVTCSICGEVRTWVPGQEALTRLLEQVERSRTLTNSVRRSL